MHNGEVSYWWRARGIPARRPSLPGSTEADVCIVGAGYTGLWTAYYLNRADPALRIVVLGARTASARSSSTSATRSTRWPGSAPPRASTRAW
jgi:glycine/D-amino acid oxidase-like deaminating enzyme